MLKHQSVRVKKLLGSNLDIDALKSKILGETPGDVDVVGDKCIGLIRELNTIASILEQFTTKTIGQYFSSQREFSRGFEDITTIIKKIRKVTTTLETEYKTRPDDVASIYFNNKKNEGVAIAINIYKRLVRYSEYLENKNNPQVGFVYQEQDVNLIVDTLDFNELFTHDNFTQTMERIVGLILSILYNSSRSVFEYIFTPDFDYAVIVEIANEAIERLHTIPELNRCTHAFGIMKKCARIFEAKFVEYYRDYLESGDNTIIFQNFAIDMQQDIKATPRIVMQLKQIMNYYKRQLSGNEPPEIIHIFSFLEDNFVQLSKEQKTQDAK